MKILPWRIQEKVLWDFDDFKTADALVRWIKSKVRLTTTWRPTESPTTPAGGDALPSEAHSL